ncbi:MULTISPECIES: MFS transporter [unclassified Fusibacter]|uniref:MFS transporter n=1 Tax=unclassified Fusibacter TaxID=2624464 RepID=UPI00101327E7|nr:MULTISPECIES: MFS transporter [unclassified Fusibacter]MCK8058863.1 MFS transporter [Fusibacter sp. A2]NPE21938.1 MFS transporter [Fusibacter sp. A1]RXV61507.1 MFS transporter [Fusibacter sp. A1]
MFEFIKKNTSLIAVSWGHFVNDFFMSVVPVVLFAFASEMKLNAIQMSMIAFVITTAGTFFQPLVGLLIDKVQKSSLLIYSLLLITLGMSLSGLITNFYLLILVVGVSALGSSVYHPLGSTITIHKTSLTKGKSLSVFMTVGSFAHSAAPIVAIPLVTIYGLKALSVLMIPGLLSCLILYMARVQEVTWTKDKDSSEGSNHAKLTKGQMAQMTIPMSIAVIKGLLYRVVIVFGVILLGIKGIEPVMAAAVLSAFMIARAFATLIGGFISDSIGEKNTLILFNTAALFSVFMLVYGGNLLSILGLVILGFTINATAAANITITHKILPNNVNYGTGLIMGFAATMSAVAILGFGVLVDRFSLTASLNVVVVLTAFMAVSSYALPKELFIIVNNSEESTL